ncbi:MAG: hypoxanthine phosphoribosyltransferase [Nitrospirae bacterium RBG_16_64_22]|nr:MAG: hypoxanthine phosphoribosyltransferase [Nitrospirae bacterium RBG_16_64_22]
MGTVDRLSPLHTPEEIGAAVRRIAARLDADFRDTRPILVGVLKGAFVFLADLARAMTVPAEIDFVRAASYGKGTETSGKVVLLMDMDIPVAGRSVVLVDDIVDSGLTLDFLRRMIEGRGPRDVRICALLDKPSRRQVHVPIDYLGFTVPDRFVVGYGIDYQERHRTLPGVFTLDQD